MPLVTSDFGYGPQQVWQNDDGTYWSPEVGPDTSLAVRPDQRDAFVRDQYNRTNDFYTRAGYQKFTPEQAQAYLASGKAPNADSPNLNPAFGPNLGIYQNGLGNGSPNDLWYGPQAGPQHNDTGPEQAQTAWNDMRNGALIMSLPFAWMGATALAGGAAAGGATAAEGGAVAGGTAAGAGEAGAGTLYAGETASGVGSSGVGLGGTGGGATGLSAAAGSESLIGGAGTDTLGGTTVGEEGFDPNLLEDPSYWNPEGGTTGLASPGAEGVAGSSTTYGNIDWEALAEKYGPQVAKAAFAAITGGLAGAKGASKPAGNTTTTQDLADWLKPYAQQNVAQGSNILSQIPSYTPLLSASNNEAMKTINGDYLNPNSNPYFASSVNDALGLAKSQFAGMYGGGPGNNLNNSGFQEGLARTLGQQATNAYAQNYNTERQRQATATFSGPAFAAQSSAAPFAANQSFGSLFPNVTSTTVPYFTNPLGNAFSGALGGYTLANGVFGGPQQKQGA